jgi:predicted NUDIX family NTP pyrophosphohydrolase
MKLSAGLLPYRRRERRIEVFLVHPGGPFWGGKDLGAWSIAKGEADPGEDLLACARREFGEETGFAAGGEFLALAPIRQAGGKRVQAWAVEMELDPERIVSNRVSLEWPPRSGRMLNFPEIDRAAWFPLDEARRRINRAQAALLDQLETLIRP